MSGPLSVLTSIYSPGYIHVANALLSVHLLEALNLDATDRQLQLFNQHFQTLLKEYPPQTSSRKSASLWLCSLHNMVNERLLKPQFDCETLDESYDCGCGPESNSSTDSTLDENGLGTDSVTGVEMIKGGR